MRKINRKWRALKILFILGVLAQVIGIILCEAGELTLGGVALGFFFGVFVSIFVFSILTED